MKRQMQMQTDSARVYGNEHQDINELPNTNEYQDTSENPYDFEIKMDTWKTILITILNILTGGLGTLIEPFLNKKSKKRIIFASILISFFQILHFLHGFSLLTGVKFLEDIYDSICDDKFFEIIFENEKNEKNDDNDNNEEQNEIIKLFNSFKDITNLNIAELISKKSRIKFLKECLGFISGMSYCNSIVSILLNFKNDEGNKLLSYKIVLYSIFNPGAGIILSSFALIPSCDCGNGIYKIKGIIICIISIILGLIVMLTPISLILGLFLTKITNRMITIFPIKITLIFFGCLGILLSIITSGFNKKLIKESYELYKKKEKEMPLPFDIIYKVGKELNLLKNKFDWESFARLIANMIIPGSGTMSLICKYKEFCGQIFFIAVIQFFGGLFFLSTILVIFQIPFFFSLFYKLFFSAYMDEINIDFIKFVDYFYTIGLCFYFTGILLILISDYFPDIENIKKELSGLAGVILNLFTGGLGTILFLEVYGELYKPDGSDNIDICDPPWTLCDVIFWYCRLFVVICRHKNCKRAMFVLILVIGGFICYFGTLYCIFFSDASKACKITYPIFYGVFSIIFGLFPLLYNIDKNNEAACPIKKIINNKYQIINIDDVEIYN